MTHRTILNMADAEALAAHFLEARRGKHGDLRMEADPDPAGDPPSGDPDPDVDPDPDPDADKLGDPGKQALDRMKTQRNEFRDELRVFQALGLTPEQIKGLQKPADDGDKPDAEEIRRQVRAELTTETNRERVLDKIETKAAKGFADPEDAVAILLRTRKAEDFLNGDKIDVEEIEDALKELLEKKPHLAAAQGGRRFQGSADGGARKESSTSIDDQIAAAEKARNFQLVIALKQQKAASATKS